MVGNEVDIKTKMSLLSDLSFISRRKRRRYNRDR